MDGHCGEVEMTQGSGCGEHTVVDAFTPQYLMTWKHIAQRAITVFTLGETLHDLLVIAHKKISDSPPQQAVLIPYGFRNILHAEISFN